MQNYSRAFTQKKNTASYKQHLILTASSHLHKNLIQQLICCLYYALFSVHAGCLFLASFLGGFGDLTAGWLLFLDALDDTDGYRLTHVTDSEAAEGWVLGKGLDAHWLLWHHAHHSGITILDAFRLLLKLLARAAVDLGLDLLEFARDVRGVAVEDRAVAV